MTIKSSSKIDFFGDYGSPIATPTEPPKAKAAPLLSAAKGAKEAAQKKSTFARKVLAQLPVELPAHSNQATSLAAGLRPSAAIEKLLAIQERVKLIPFKEQYKYSPEQQPAFVPGCEE